MTWGELASGSHVDAPRRGGINAVATGAESGPNRHRQLRSSDGRHGDRPYRSANSGIAASEAAAGRVTRDSGWAPLKRPGRGVPPPRSGLPLLGVP
jgi:hypothetical protein